MSTYYSSLANIVNRSKLKWNILLLKWHRYFFVCQCYFDEPLWTNANFSTHSIIFYEEGELNCTLSGDRLPEPIKAEKNKHQHLHVCPKRAFTNSSTTLWHLTKIPQISIRENVLLFTSIKRVSLFLIKICIKISYNKYARFLERSVFFFLRF